MRPRSRFLNPHNGRRALERMDRPPNLSQLFPPEVPRRSVSFLRDGFSVSPIGHSGVRVIEGFCSEAGVSYLLSREQELVPGDDAFTTVFSATVQDSILLPLYYRAAMLTGLPFEHAGAISVGRSIDEAEFGRVPRPPRGGCRSAS